MHRRVGRGRRSRCRGARARRPARDRARAGSGRSGAAVRAARDHRDAASLPRPSDDVVARSRGGDSRRVVRRRWNHRQLADVAPPARSIRHEWAKTSGLSLFADERFTRAMDAVCNRIGVGTGESPVNANNEALRRACTSLGWRWSHTPRNARGCDPTQCGWCVFGCRHGGKQVRRSPSSPTPSKRGT